MKVHFIAIGGSAMHNLAIALSRMGDEVTGSDDEIFEPSKGRLKREGILPETIGWNEQNIHVGLDAVIVGMHAREDNPELLKAQELGIPTYSYPEYLYEKSKNKIRLVIGGSHGKTSITSMILHAFKALKLNVDYMVGAQLEGYDCMVKMSEEAEIMVLEGDEYLSSPIDRRPKFHLYKPTHALISGIAWDHINVFPTLENYISQFTKFCECVEKGGRMIYASNDEQLVQVVKPFKEELILIPYDVPRYSREGSGTKLNWQGGEYALQIFGKHNLQNIIGAMHLAESVGVKNDDFLKAMHDFTGASKRLEKVLEKGEFLVYKDFAHSPSKLKATTAAVREQFPNHQLIACIELHTFSSLNKEFLPQYKNTMDGADEAFVYYNHQVVAHKKLPMLSEEEVQNHFGEKVKVRTNTAKLQEELKREVDKQTVVLFMSSGNFDGIDFNAFADVLQEQT